MKQLTSQILVKLGLTKDESECYILLLNNGSLNAQQIALEMSILPNAVYRLAKSLREKGFIVVLDTSPQTFQSIQATIAIENFSEKQKKELEELKIESIRSLSKVQKNSSQTKIDIVAGKKDFFTTFTKLAKDTKKELLVISIGESVSDDVKLATRDAIERGVEVRIIFHKYDNKNKDLLRTWMRMGCEVKHFSDSGYHLNVFDGKKSILVANNPENTEERTGMVIHSEGVSRALKTYFYSMWEKGVIVH